MAFGQMTEEQRAAALEKAREVRSARAELSKKIKSGEVTPQSVLEKRHDDSVVSKMRVSTFLRCIPGIGISKSKQFMEDNGIADTRRLRGLTNAQVDAIFELIA